MADEGLRRAADILDPGGAREAAAHPAELAAKLDPGFLTPPHILLLSEIMARAAIEGGKRIIVSMPPRHGKSETVSKWTPTWLLDRWPSKRVILSSYEAEFAASWGQKVRDLVREHRGELNVRLSDSAKARHSWETTRGGGMVTAGVGGPITGKGADLLIVDDPVKNDQEANSGLIRQRTWEWWTSTAYTRLEPGASAVVVMTRWHEDDLVGRFIEQMADGGEEWEVIELPAIAGANDPLGREAGDALWPQRYGVDELAGIKDAVDRYVWESLYQQNPMPRDADSCAFDTDKIRVYRESDCLPPRWTGLFERNDSGLIVPKADDEGGWRVWDWPAEGRSYAMGVDSASGTPTGDFSAAAIYDVESGDQVAEFHKRISIKNYARQIARAGVIYADPHGVPCFINPELNQQGHAVVALLIEWGYLNLYVQRRHDRTRQQTGPETFGWQTGQKTRALLIEAIASAIDDGYAGVRSRRAYGEFLTFVEHPDTGKYQASEGHFDDLVIAHGLVLAILDEQARQAPERRSGTVFAESESDSVTGY